MNESQWALVLAAGDGTRLRPLTTDGLGRVVPKQYCSLCGGPSLLEAALARAERLVGRDRTLVVVAAEHERFWRSQLAHLPSANVIVQPCNRGTAVGVLLPLLLLLARDPQATVAVLPSDHHVRDEPVLDERLKMALARAADGEAGIVLLGMSPDEATPDYGWIVPAAGCGAVCRVDRFVEKPGPAEAAALLAQGAIWNTFVFAGRARTLRDLIRDTAGGVAKGLESALRMGGDAVPRFYELSSPVDLSRDVFARAPARLRVLAVPPCGWTDLGTPQRVLECLAQHPAAEPLVAGGAAPRLDLASSALRLAATA